MRVLVMLLIVALAVLALGVQRPDLALAQGGAAAAGALALILLALIWIRPRPARTRPAARHVLIDGSNLIYWQDETAPSLMPVKAVIAVMQACGLQPGVIFDANVGYKIGARYQGDRAMARMLNLPQDRVLVVPKGVPADRYILQAARDLAAPVVTNDRYRDWAAEFPEVASAGKLIRGGWRGGDLWLDREA